ncbi:hypothetical protein BGZ58_006064 [Dissophora ornata]|nr:hypothetical protein BGZ58_006064 [Dissophora ornata]
MAIADLIDRGKGGWKKIVIYGCYECVCFDSLSAEALLKHASTLEILTMESAPGFSSKYIQQLLCTAPKLKEFYLLGPERLRDNVDGTLDVRDVVESEWVCTELEVFGCQIGNIPRPDITRTIDGHPASNYVVKGTLEESIDLQRRVCSQLGRLTRLTELTLGTSFKSYWGGVPEYHRLYDCLSLALESGLDLLCDLKELQIFELNDMEVYIRRDEEWNWVKKNWPKAAKSGIRAD